MEKLEMGEPVKLYRNDEETTAYGPNAMGALLRDGWQLTPPTAEPQAAPQPAMDAAPQAATVVAKKRAGEYGSGAGTQANKVDKAKLAEVKKERAKDKKDGNVL